MADHEAACLNYLRLAIEVDRKGIAPTRDRLLVLAAITACRSGWLDVAESCRATLLRSNPHHLLTGYPHVPAALRDPERAAVWRMHEKRCPYERAEHLVAQLEPDNVDVGDGDAYERAKQWASRLEGTAPPPAADARPAD